MTSLFPELFGISTENGHSPLAQGFHLSGKSYIIGDLVVS